MWRTSGSIKDSNFKVQSMLKLYAEKDRVGRQLVLLDNGEYRWRGDIPAANGPGLEECIVEKDEFFFKCYEHAVIDSTIDQFALRAICESLRAYSNFYRSKEVHGNINTDSLVFTSEGETILRYRGYPQSDDKLKGRSDYMCLVMTLFNKLFGVSTMEDAMQMMKDRTRYHLSFAFLELVVKFIYNQAVDIFSLAESTLRSDIFSYVMVRQLTESVVVYKKDNKHYILKKMTLFERMWHKVDQLLGVFSIIPFISYSPKEEKRSYNLEEKPKVTTGAVYRLFMFLAEMHKEWVHRDICPRNIVVSKHKKLQLHLVDFGVATHCNVLDIHYYNFAYHSPELKEGPITSHLLREDDVYALCLSLLVAISGRKPDYFASGETWAKCTALHHLNSTIVKPLVSGLQPLSKRPTAAEMASKIKELL